MDIYAPMVARGLRHLIGQVGMVLITLLKANDLIPYDLL